MPEALILDGDDTTFLSQAAWSKGILQLWKRTFPTLEADAEKRYRGRSSQDVWEEISKDHPAIRSKEEHENDLDAFAQSIYADVPAMPGIEQVLTTAADLNKKSGLASSSMRKWFGPALERLGLRCRFGVVLGREDVVNAKPDPEILEKAASALGVNHADCLVVDDLGPGLQAARRLGMTSVWLQHAGVEEVPRAHADHVIRELTELIPMLRGDA